MQEEKPRTLLAMLRAMAHEISRDKYMVMEYLGPVVDGCRAALKVSVESAMSLHTLAEATFDQYMESTGQSFSCLTVCFRTTDTNEVYSLVFDRGTCKVYEECAEPDVAISGKTEALRDVLDVDSKTSPTDVLGTTFTVHGSNALEIVEGLGLLCFPSLLQLARSGVDPSSLSSEDADSVFMVATTNLVTKMVHRWVRLQMENEE